VVADAGYSGSARFRQGLTDRGLVYVLAVAPATTAHPERAVLATAPSSGAGLPVPPASLKTLALATGRSGLRQATILVTVSLHEWGSNQHRCSSRWTRRYAQLSAAGCQVLRR
jgi:DDE superfamily endonuclease